MGKFLKHALAACRGSGNKQEEEEAFFTETPPNRLLGFFYFASCKEFWAATKHEFVKLVNLIWPIVLSNVCFAIMNIENTSLVVRSN